MENMEENQVIVKRYGKCRRNDMENMGEKKVE